MIFLKYLLLAILVFAITFITYSITMSKYRKEFMPDENDENILFLRKVYGNSFNNIFIFSSIFLIILALYSFGILKKVMFVIMIIILILHIFSFLQQLIPNIINSIYTLKHDKYGLEYYFGKYLYAYLFTELLSILPYLFVVLTIK